MYFALCVMRFVFILLISMYRFLNPFIILFRMIKMVLKKLLRRSGKLYSFSFIIEMKKKFLFSNLNIADRHVFIHNLWGTIWGIFPPGHIAIIGTMKIMSQNEFIQSINA